MEWFFYSLLCAFFLATSDTFSKRALQDINEYLVAWGRLLAAIPVLISILIIFQPSLHIDKTFLFIVASIIPLEISALVLYMKAIKISPLSLTVPFLALTPVFLIGTSYIMLKELPDFSGAIGILFVAIGAYTLNIDNLKEGILAPFRNLKKEKGSILMIVVAFIYSITSNLGKIAIRHSNPIFFSAIYVTVVTISFIPLISLRTTPFEIKNALRNKNLFYLGVFYALMITFHNLAIIRTEVSYMISVKRTSLIFSIIYGRFIFHETHFKERLVGGIFMVIGVMLIII